MYAIQPNVIVFFCCCPIGVWSIHEGQRVTQMTRTEKKTRPATDSFGEPATAAVPG
jgi:hypothetical protein